MVLLAVQGQNLIVIDIVFGVMPCGPRGCLEQPQQGPDNTVNIEADPILAALPVPFELRSEVGENPFDLSTKASQEEVYKVLGTLFEPASLRGQNGAVQAVPLPDTTLTSGMREDPLQARRAFRSCAAGCARCSHSGEGAYMLPVPGADSFSNACDCRQVSWWGLAKVRIVKCGLLCLQQVRDFCSVINLQATTSSSGRNPAARAAAAQASAEAASTSQAAAKLEERHRMVAEAACASPDRSTNLPTGNDFRVAAFLLMNNSVDARGYFGFGGLTRSADEVADLLGNTDDTSAGGLPAVVWAKVQLEGTSAQSRSPEQLVETDKGSFDAWEQWQRDQTREGVRCRLRSLAPHLHRCLSWGPAHLLFLVRFAAPWLCRFARWSTTLRYVDVAFVVKHRKQVAWYCAPQQHHACGAMDKHVEGVCRTAKAYSLPVTTFWRPSRTRRSARAPSALCSCPSASPESWCSCSRAAPA